MEPGLGRRPPPSAGKSATTVSPRFWPARESGQFAVKWRKRPPFRGLTTDSGSVGDALEALAQSDGADVGVALEAAGLATLAWAAP